MTSAARISLFIAISLTLHLVCLSIDSRFPTTVLHQQDVLYGYISVPRSDFLPEKKTIQVDSHLEKRVLPQKKTVAAKPKAPKSVVPQKHIAPVTDASSRVNHEDILPSKTLSDSIQVEGGSEHYIDVASLPENAVVDEASNPVDVRETHERVSSVGGAEETSLSESVVTRSGSSTDGGERGFQSALPRYDLNPKPIYPEVARRRGWEGTVLFTVEVLRNGNVGDLKMVQSSGYRSLDRAAKKAIRRWVFKAARSFGHAVDSRVVVPIDFVLDQY